MQKRILIINTGGTLSSVKGCNGLVPGMSSGDMLEELRMVSRNLELEAEDFCSLDSSNIGPEDWTGLAKLIAKRSYDYDGIVVIHGTDTLAYTSAMLSFMLQNISIPIVVEFIWQPADIREFLWRLTARLCLGAEPLKFGP